MRGHPPSPCSGRGHATTSSSPATAFYPHRPSEGHNEQHAVFAFGSRVRYRVYGRRRCLRRRREPCACDDDDRLHRRVCRPHAAERTGRGTACSCDGDVGLARVATVDRQPRGGRLRHVCRGLAGRIHQSEAAATISGLTCGRSYDVGIDAADAAGNRSGLVRALFSTSPCARDAVAPASRTASESVPRRRPASRCRGPPRLTMRACRPTGSISARRASAARPGRRRSSTVPVRQVVSFGGRRSGRSREQVAHLLDHHVHAALRTHTIRLEKRFDGQQPQYRCRRRARFALEGDGDAYSGRGRVLGVGSGHRDGHVSAVHGTSRSRARRLQARFLSRHATARPRAKRPEFGAGTGIVARVTVVASSSTQTASDTSPPTVPAALRVVSAAPTSLSMSWPLVERQRGSLRLRRVS